MWTLWAKPRLATQPRGSYLTPEDALRNAAAFRVAGEPTDGLGLLKLYARSF